MAMGSKVKLGNLLSLLTDYHANGAYKKLKENVELFDEPDYAVMIRTTNFEQNNFDSNLKYISEHAYNFLEKSKVKAGDIIMNKIANAGSSYLMPDLNCPVSLAMNLFLLRIDEDKANSTFVYLYLKLNEDYVKSFANGSVTKTITKEAVRNLEIELPERSMQDYIVKVYMDYVSKLTLNQKTNQTLEQMVQALFKSWFVDFDPVFDNLLASADFKLENLETSLPDELIQKAQRRLAALDSLENAAEIKTSLSALAHELQALSPTKEATQAAVQILGKTAETPVKANVSANPKILAQHANTHAHFPNEFEHNEQLGWVPKGWSVDKADKVADIAIGKTPPRKQKEWFSDNPLNNKVWVSIKDMGGNKTFIGDSSEYLTSESISKFNVKVVPKDSVILSFKLTLGRVCITKCDLTTNEAIAHFVNPKHSMSKEYVYLYLKCFDYGSLGSTSSIATAVNSKIIKAMPFLVPNKTVLSSFKGSVENIFFKMDTLGSETTSLTKLRDTLLPKLISGELQIPDVTIDEEVVN